MTTSLFQLERNELLQEIPAVADLADAMEIRYVYIRQPHLELNLQPPTDEDPE